MSYRADLDALDARHAALDAEVAQKTKERDAVRSLLDDAKARARLPVLDNIRVASPCTMSWADMPGDERVRACGSCKKNVYNLSEMTRDEAEALIVQHEGKLCVRYYQRKDGMILTADCTVGAQRSRRRKWIAAGAVALLAGGVGAAVALRGGDRDDETDVMGQVTIDEAVMGKTEVVHDETVPATPAADVDLTPKMGAMMIEE
jgi:hypothetical protein